MASTVLSRTQTSGSLRKFTLSAWNKRSGLSSYQGILNAYSSDSDRNAIFWQTTDELVVYFKTSGSSQIFLQTNAKFRDTNGWYHVVIAVDTEQATASNRVKMYVNGEQQTSFSTETYPSQNSDFSCINRNGQAVELGVLKYGAGPSTGYFDGLMSHYHFIDGTQYQASDFGQFDANGVWTIKTSPSVTYGTNGFFILEDGNSVTDQSGNSNNLTVASGTLTNTEDNPSNVFATVNSLFNPDPSNPLSSISNGNLSFTTNSTSDTSMGVTTFGASSGKWYAEIKSTGESGTGEAFAGIGYDIYENATTSMNSDSSFMWNVCSNGDAKFGGSGQGIGNWSNTYTTNDIISIALDLDNNRVYFAKNGQYADGSGNWNQAFTGSPAYATITADKTYFFCAGDKSGSQTASWSCNFGNGYFGTTAVSSAGTNASGIGIFEYDVPTGYTALSTKGLNL